MEAITITGSHSSDEISSVLGEAIKSQTDFAHARFRRFQAECRIFEEKYGLSSERFAEKFDAGELGDDEHWFDWYAVNKGRQLWGKKYQILKELNWTT